MADADPPEGHTGWTTSLGLLAGIRENEAAAWERFTRLYTPLLHHWFRLSGVPPGEWADLEQEVFFAVARGLPGYEHTPQRGAFRGWLRAITRNKVADLCRGRSPTPADPSALAALPSTPAADVPEEHDLLLRRALELIRTDFADSSWQAFCLVVLENRTPVEAAAALGLTLNAVYLAKARVLRRLREEFAGLLDAPPPTG